MPCCSTRFLLEQVGRCERFILERHPYVLLGIRLQMIGKLWMILFGSLCESIDAQVTETCARCMDRYCPEIEHSGWRRCEECVMPCWFSLMTPPSISNVTLISYVCFVLGFIQTRMCSCSRCCAMIRASSNVMFKMPSRNG